MEKQVRKKTLFYGLVAILFASTLGMLIYAPGVFRPGLNPASSPIPAARSTFLSTFASVEALKGFLKNNSQTQGPFSFYSSSDLKVFSTPTMLAAIPAQAQAVGAYAENVQHSTTNVQVTGVDEADTVKVDDNGYMYVLSGDTVYILTAYPPTQAEVVAKIKFDDMYAVGIFVSGNRLVVLGSKYDLPVYAYPYYSSSGLNVTTYLRLYDISDKSHPVLIKEFTSAGSYFNSRMIGDYVYFVTSEPAYIVGDAVPLPEISQNGEITEIPPTQIHYFNGTDEYYEYTTFVALNIQNTTEAPVYLTVMLGGTSNMYVSQDNMYVTFQDWYWGGNTTIYRIHLQASNMTFEASGKIP